MTPAIIISLVFAIAVSWFGIYVIAYWRGYNEAREEWDKRGQALGYLRGLNGRLSMYSEDVGKYENGIKEAMEEVGK